jgi:hypothetical protein
MEFPFESCIQNLITNVKQLSNSFAQFYKILQAKYGRA